MLTNCLLQPKSKTFQHGALHTDNVWLFVFFFFFAFHSVVAALSLVIFTPL